MPKSMVHAGLLTRFLSHSSGGKMAFRRDDEQPGSAAMAVMGWTLFFWGFLRSQLCRGVKLEGPEQQQQQQEGGQQGSHVLM